MRDERPDAGHVQVQLAEQRNVIGHARISLAGNAHHDAAADFKAKLAQPPQNGDAVAPVVSQRRVNLVKQIPVRRFKPEQVAVRPGFAPGRKVLVRPFAETQRHCERRFVFDAPDDFRQTFRRNPVIFAALQHHRAVAELHGLLRRFKNFTGRHPVAGQFFISRAQAAIGALPRAMIRDLHQPAQMHGVADVLPARLVGAPPQFREPLRICLAEPAENFVFVKASIHVQFNQLLRVADSH